MKTAPYELSERGIPRTRLTLFLQGFGLAMGIIGLALRNQELMIVGGLCCCFIDFLRIGNSLWFNRELIARSLSYVLIVPLVSLHYPLLVAVAIAGLFDAAVLLSIAYKPTPRWHPLSFPKKPARSKN